MTVCYPYTLLSYQTTSLLKYTTWTLLNALDSSYVCWRDGLHRYPNQALDGVCPVPSVCLPDGHCPDEPTQWSCCQWYTQDSTRGE